MARLTPGLTILIICALMGSSMSAIDLTLSKYYEGPCGPWAESPATTLKANTTYFAVLAAHIHWEAMYFLFTSTMTEPTNSDLSHLHHTEMVTNATATHIVESGGNIQATVAQAILVDNEPYFYNWTGTILSEGVEPFAYASKLVWVNEAGDQELYQECVYLSPEVTLAKWKVLSLAFPTPEDTAQILEQVERLGFNTSYASDLRGLSSDPVEWEGVPRSYTDTALQATLVLNGTRDDSPIYYPVSFYYNSIQFSSMADLYKELTRPIRDGVKRAVDLCSGEEKPMYCDYWN